MNATDHQNRPRIELVPGDCFVYEFEVRGEQVFTYGLLERIKKNGKYQADFKADSVETTISCEGGRAVGTVARISKRAYELARLRGWPKSQTGAGAIIDYSVGKRTCLSFQERWKLLFIR